MITSTEFTQSDGCYYALGYFDPPPPEYYPLYKFLAERYPRPFQWTITPRKHAQGWRKWQGTTPRESRGRWVEEVEL